MIYEYAFVWEKASGMEIWNLDPHNPVHIMEGKAIAIDCSTVFSEHFAFDFL